MDKSFTGRITKKFKNLLVKGRDFTSNIFKKKTTTKMYIYILERSFKQLDFSSKRNKTRKYVPYESI